MRTLIQCEGKGDEREGRDVKRGIHKGEGKRKRERAKCAHGQDRGTHSPL
jgi:hypothetical protein